MRNVIACTVHRVERRRNSVSGNPRKRLVTDRGTFSTAADAGVAYAISDNWSEKPLILVLNGRGSIVDIKEERS